jgi:cytochrome P450
MDSFNPHSNMWLANKFHIYEDLRSRDKAYYSESYKMHVITRYADVLFALSNPEIFSSAKGNLIVEIPQRFGRTLGASDNPQHDAFKAIARKAYSKDNIERITAAFGAYATTALQNPPLDIGELSNQFSAQIVAEMLGLPLDKTEIQTLVYEIQKHSTRAVKNTPNDIAYNNLFKIIVKLIMEGKSFATQPGIYQEYMTHSPGDTSAMSLFTGPTISGASSMTGALQFLTLDLYTEGQLDALLADRNLIPNAVNESLRYRASTGRFSRTVTREIELHGVLLKPGDRVALCLESANRDPAKFVNPTKFDLHRDTSGHLAFGHGVHACIAMAICKAVMAKYLEVLLNVVGKYKISTDPKDFQYVITASGNDDMLTELVLEKAS